MLVSPSRIHSNLVDLTLKSDDLHTALLILPQGQLISLASTFGVRTSDQGEGSPKDREEEGLWLDGPERLRLLLGLASQWEEDESPRVECEVSSPFRWKAGCT